MPEEDTIHANKIAISTSAPGVPLATTDICLQLKEEHHRNTLRWGTTALDAIDVVEMYPIQSFKLVSPDAAGAISTHAEIAFQIQHETM